jgi:hypothetical protein
MAAGHAFLIVSGILIAFLHGAEVPLLLWLLISGTGFGICFGTYPNLIIASVPSEFQGAMSSLVLTVQNVLPSIFPIVLFAILNEHIATVVNGAVYYTNDGFTTSYLVLTSAPLLGLVLALLLPATLRRPD